MPIHQNLNPSQRTVDFEKIAIRCRQSASLLAWQHASPAARHAAPALLCCPITAAVRAALDFQVLNFFAACQDKQWWTWVEVRHLHSCRLWYPQHWGFCTPHDSGCQISNPTGEEFKTTLKPNKNQVRLDLSFSCNLMSATAQLRNMSRPPSKKSDFEQRAGNHGLSDSSVQIH